jgi:FrmR/RcnR family transcriptional regulator, repressor of rcnA expression
MAHTTTNRRALLHRVRRLRGQIDAVERLLENGNECIEVLQQIAACRGSINGLMSEIAEGHIRFHIAGERDAKARGKAMEELIRITRSYLK